MLLEYQQVATYLYTACLHEKHIGQTDCTYQVGMIYKIFTHELIAGRVGYALDVMKANKPPSFNNSIALTKK